MPIVTFKCSCGAVIRFSWRGAENVWAALGLRAEHEGQGHAVILTAQRGKRREVVA